jgi:hypothetical protein
MKNHVKLYMDAFGYNVSDFISCECCGAKAVDINHIECRGMGGDPQNKKETIENLMAMCRSCHTQYGDIVKAKEWLKRLHLKFMQTNGISTNNKH